MNTIDMVREFHEKFRQPLGDEPLDGHSGLVVFAERLSVMAEQLLVCHKVLAGIGRPEAQVFLRAHLHVEETGEMLAALAEEDDVALLDSLTDLQYVLDGTYVATGLAGVKMEAFRRVHAANMKKKVPTEPGERISKPEGWVAPELGDLI